MKVVLDSNIIIADFWLESTNFRLLLESAENGDIEIYIPEVVYDEVLNKFKQRLEKSRTTIKSELQKFKRNSKKSIDTPIDKDSIEKSISEYENQLKKIIKKYKIKILEYPNINHKFLANKAIHKLKPFNANEKGYRDCLIWENVKGLLTDFESVAALPELVFISNNYKDFASNDYKLHSDLISELEDEEFDSKSIIIYFSLAEFNDKQTKLFFTQSTSFENRIRNNEIWDFDLKPIINDYLLKNFVDSLLYDYDITEEYSDPTVTYFDEENYDIEITDVKRLNAKEFLVDVNFDLKCEIDFFLDKHDYHILEENNISIKDSDWNRHVMLANISISIPISMFLILDKCMKATS